MRSTKGWHNQFTQVCNERQVIMNWEKIDVKMERERVSKIVTVTVVERPARKLILQRAKKTTGGNYFDYCEEMCCEWQELLNNIPEKLDLAALLTLPTNLIKLGTTDTAAGVEVPIYYAKPILTGYDIIDLPPCIMLFFQGMPFENDEDYGQAIDIVEQAITSYQPEQYGFRYAPELAPHFNFGASAKIGAKKAVPVTLCSP